MPKIYLVIPTYNEKENIVKVLEKVFSLNIEGLNVLVVDDNSPDGTGQVVERLKAGNIRLDVLHRGSKEGLGKAYVAGFKEALSRGADIVFEMDADLSHDPKYLPDFLQAINLADLVLGSRYIKGGGTTNWNFFRRLISQGGNVYARIVLGMPIKDLTGGFKCYRREVLEKIGLDSLSSVGYNFQIETTYKTYKLGFKIKEIPINFIERVGGKSKFSIKIILESFWKVLLLRMNKKGDD
ncbi:MAG: polyprenol monophosphomannose synthase [Patescibacteria group bacterium]|nr:polyprenol monophosphomannose synthase [Patescibacteria group bacterium]